MDVVGFPSVGPYTPILEESIFKRIGEHPPPKPVDVTPSQCREGSHDAQLVRLEASLIESFQQPDGNVLVLAGSGVVFNAQLFGMDNLATLANLPKGSRLQLTGICSVEVDWNRKPWLFHINLRNESDIVVLEKPPWL